MPPKGGYESIKYKRNLPIRGPAGWVVFAGVGAVCAFGFYKVGAGNNERKWVLVACWAWCLSGGSLSWKSGRKQTVDPGTGVECWA